MTKNQILNNVLNALANDGSALFRKAHITEVMNKDRRKLLDKLYEAHVQAMDDVYQIKFR